MKKIAFPLVAALAVGACASPTGSTEPSATPVATVSPSPSAPAGGSTQTADDIQNTAALSVISPSIGVMLLEDMDAWIVFWLEGAPSDWSFSFSNPSIVEFYPDGVRTYESTKAFAGVRAVALGTTTVTATNGGETITFEIEVFN
jgi:hypothetical protein